MNAQKQKWLRASVLAVAVTLLTMGSGAAGVSLAQLSPAQSVQEAQDWEVGQVSCPYHVYFSNGYFPDSVYGAYADLCTAQQVAAYLRDQGFRAYVLRH